MAKKKEEEAVEEAAVAAFACANCEDSGLACSVCHADGGNKLD